MDRLLDRHNLIQLLQYIGDNELNVGWLHTADYIERIDSATVITIDDVEYVRLPEDIHQFLIATQLRCRGLRHSVAARDFCDLIIFWIDFILSNCQ